MFFFPVRKHKASEGVQDISRLMSHWLEDLDLSRKDHVPRPSTGCFLKAKAPVSPSEGCWAERQPFEALD